MDGDQRNLTAREFSYRVKLERGEYVIEASDPHDARTQTLQMLAEDPSLIEVEKEVTTSQWLIERGQPEGQERPTWLENSASHPASHYHWTDNANEAAMFPTREMAEDWIRDNETGGRAVEHGFMGWARV